MSGHTFKVGDRVRDLDAEEIGTVDAIDPGHHKSVRVTFRSGAAPWYFWFHPTELEIAGTPMSPEARMVWHAMRAGAKRVGRKHVTSKDGTCYRIHKYEADHIVIRVDIALAPIADEAVQP